LTVRKTVRCAIYTRKSSEHNLDLEFNSLDAQREACEAYIKSQQQEGWVLIPDHYDDGGISGGSLNRPDLQRLLSDIRTGKVDIIVVYKVDRLTRSLADFAKLVELFDAQSVSFVSITQSFNTTSSMGRLTLNILLSFAQFEREVIGERVRDKVAASKAKGLWMGGSVPLGYGNKDKKLVIVPGEADTIRMMFRRYLELGSTDLLLKELRQNGVRTKHRPGAAGNLAGGVCFRKGNLAYLLKNRVYVGQLVHRGKIYAADHDAIVDRELFDAVQAKLQSNTQERKVRLKASPYLLTGLLFDSAGNRMTPSHTRKKGVRYRYYVSQGVLQRRDQSELGEVTRVSAPDLEVAISAFLHQKVQVKGPLADSLRAVVGQITVYRTTVEIRLVSGSGTEDAASAPQTVVMNWQRKATRVEQGIAHMPSSGQGGDIKARDAILAAIGKARAWLTELIDGGKVSEIAERTDRSERQIRVLLNLAFLPPQQVKAILDGTIAVDTITNAVRNVPVIWPEAAATATPAG
jgi:site-specific DNA recombinase